MVTGAAGEHVAGLFIVGDDIGGDAKRSGHSPLAALRGSRSWHLRVDHALDLLLGDGDGALGGLRAHIALS